MSYSLEPQQPSGAPAELEKENNHQQQQDGEPMSSSAHAGDKIAAESGDAAALVHDVAMDTTLTAATTTTDSTVASTTTITTTDATVASTSAPVPPAEDTATLVSGNHKKRPIQETPEDQNDDNSQRRQHHSSGDALSTDELPGDEQQEQEEQGDTEHTGSNDSKQPAPSSISNEPDVVSSKVSQKVVDGHGKDKDATTHAQDTAAAATVDPKRPIKRARTAYFIFAEDKRAAVQKQHQGQGVAAVARALGQIWATISPDEKERYQQLAAAERERVAQELQAWKDAGGKAELPASTAAAASTDPAALIFPVARIRKIVKLDPEVRGVSKEALLLICKAAELATAKLGRECVRVAQIQNRRKLLPDDVAQVCSSREQFLFLRDDIQDLARHAAKEHAAAVAGNKSKANTLKPGAKPAGKPLTDYFAIKSKPNNS